MGFFFTVSFFSIGLFPPGLQWFILQEFWFDLFWFVSREANDTYPSEFPFHLITLFFLIISLVKRSSSPDKLLPKFDFDGLAFNLRFSNFSLTLLITDDQVPDRDFFLKSLLALT